MYVHRFSYLYYSNWTLLQIRRFEIMCTYLVWSKENVDKPPENRRFLQRLDRKSMACKFTTTFCLQCAWSASSTNWCGQAIKPILVLYWRKLWLSNSKGVKSNTNLAWNSRFQNIEVRNSHYKSNWNIRPSWLQDIKFCQWGTKNQA